MKKLYQEEKWKRRSKKRSEAVLESLHKKKRGTKRKEKVTYEYGKAKRHKNEVTIAAPGSFSLIDNSEEMLRFFHDVNIYVEKERDIFFEMAAIENMTTDAILYMLSRFEYYKQHHRNYKISGNVPKNDECRNIFISSGFYKYVRASGTRGQSDANILTVQSASQVEPQIAKEVTHFARDRLGKRDMQISKSMYSTMIECMANTKNHAYEMVGGKWWLMAAYRENFKTVHFTFLDNGLTIPTTIKKNLKEYLANIAGTLLPVVQTQDHRLIESALKGEFRTKTGVSYRGKGLPKIYEYSNNKNIENLVVISRKGYINLGTGSTQDLNEKFLGTLLSWDFI
jgi:hypothetical protein